MAAIHLAVTSRELACDVRELVLSLGYRVLDAQQARHARGDACAPRYLLRFLTDDQVFLLSRKQRLHKERLRHDPQMARWRYIVGVRRVSSRPVRCVQVDSPDHLYLAGTA